MRSLRFAVITSILAVLLFSASLSAQTLTARVTRGNVRPGPGTSCPVVGRVRKGGNFPIEERQGSLKLPLALSPLARIQGLPPDRRKILNSNEPHEQRHGLKHKRMLKMLPPHRLMLLLHKKLLLHKQRLRE